jgi:hypothetical protein
VSGHSSKRALAVYQSLALTDVAQNYQDAIRTRQHDVQRVSPAKQKLYQPYQPHDRTNHDDPGTRRRANERGFCR